MHRAMLPQYIPKESIHVSTLVIEDLKASVKPRIALECSSSSSFLNDQIRIGNIILKKLSMLSSSASTSIQNFTKLTTRNVKKRARELSGKETVPIGGSTSAAASRRQKSHPRTEPECLDESQRKNSISAPLLQFFSPHHFGTMHKKHNFRHRKKEFEMQQQQSRRRRRRFASPAAAIATQQQQMRRGGGAHTRREEGSTKDDDVAQRCLALPSVSSKQPSCSFIHLHCYSSISGHKPPARHVVVQGPFYPA
jgi:hypothetical protein